VHHRFRNTNPDQATQLETAGQDGLDVTVELEHALGLCIKFTPAWRQLRTLTHGAVEKLYVEAFLELPDPHRHSRLRRMQFLRSPAKPAKAYNPVEDFKRL
jgi:hypothetical protein